AVLCLVVTREGTSIQIIENRFDPTMPDEWGQRLYFNAAGRRTNFTAERRSDVAARVEAGEARADDVGALDAGADMVAIIQVPLRLPHGRPRRFYAAPSTSRPTAQGLGGGSGSDVERAVIGH